MEVANGREKDSTVTVNQDGVESTVSKVKVAVGTTFHQRTIDNNLGQILLTNPICD